MANLVWNLNSEGKSVEPIDGEHMTFKQMTCDKYVDILKAETHHKRVVTKFYADLIDDTEHVSISALLVNRKTKAKKRAAATLETIADIWAAKEIALNRFEAAQKLEREARAEYEGLLDLYLTRKAVEDEK